MFCEAWSVNRTHTLPWSNTKSSLFHDLILTGVFFSVILLEQVRFWCQTFKNLLISILIEICLLGEICCQCVLEEALRDLFSNSSRQFETKQLQRKTESPFVRTTACTFFVRILYWMQRQIFFCFCFDLYESGPDWTPTHSSSDIDPADPDIILHELESSNCFPKWRRWNQSRDIRNPTSQLRRTKQNHQSITVSGFSLSHFLNTDYHKIFVDNDKYWKIQVASPLETITRTAIFEGRNNKEERDLPPDVWDNLPAFLCFCSAPQKTMSH